MLKIKVEIDRDLQDIVPGFIKNRHKDLETIKLSMKSEKIEDIEVIGHKLAGNAGSYGFEDLGTIGATLEKAAKEHNRESIEKCISDIEDYLERIEVIYV